MTTPHSNNTPQQLREALQKLEVPKTVVWVDDEMKVETDYLTDKTIGEILALFTTAQLQLVSELEGKLPKRIGSGMRLGHDHVIDEVEKLLEHKKQELERGK